MGRKIQKPGRKQKTVDDEDLDIVPTCDFGYDIPSDFEDEEVDEELACESDESDDVDQDFLKIRGDKIDRKQLELKLREESKRTGVKLVNLSDLLSSDDESPPSKSTTNLSKEDLVDYKGEIADDGSGQDESDEEDDDGSGQDESDEEGDDGSGEDESDGDDEQLSASEGDDDEPEAHAAVLSVIEQLSRRDDARLRRNADQLIEQATAACSTSETKLTLDALLNPLQTNSMFAGVKSTFDKFVTDKKTKVADVPLEAVDKRRLERSAGFQRTKDEMDKWAHLVQANRRAESLTFPLKQEKYNESSASLVAKFKSTNSLENDLKELTKMYKETEKQLSQGEKLDENVIGAEVMEKRQDQIAKMRSLLFYHELRAKRIKKIKSKAFRKHLKKAQSKSAENEEQDEEMLQEEREKRELERINARMSLRVKNTSKWMKSALKHGGLADAEVKEKVADQQRGIEALRSRIQSLKDEDDCSSSDEDDDKAAAEVSLLSKEIDNEQPEKRKGVYGLKFMVRAAEQQKAQAQAMMREFESAAAGSDADESDAPIDEPSPAAVSGRRSFGPGSTLASLSDSGGSKVNILPNSLQIEQVGFTSAGFRSRVSGNIDTATKSAIDNEDAKAETAANNHFDFKQGATEPVANEGLASKEPASKRNKKSKAKTKEAPSADNPWQHGNSAAKADKKSSAKLLEMAVVDENDEDGGFSLVPAAANKEHRALIQAAFATAGDEVEDFLAEKQAIVSEDLPDEPDTVLPGWGSWSGSGLKPSRAAKRRAGERLAEQAARKKAAIDRRQDGSMSHVIINEKHDKKLQKYRLKSVPFPYANAELYERSLQIPLGSEWHSQSAHTDLIQPTIKCKMGQIIEPITYSKPMKRQQHKSQSKAKIWKKEI